MLSNKSFNRAVGVSDDAIGEKRYSGTWVYASGGSYGLLTTTSATGTATGTVLGVSAEGVGNALLSADSGSGSLRCEFRYSEWTATGIGVCQDDAGRLFAMQIK